MLQGNKGLTLVEVLIAMVVLLLVSLALMQTALVTIDSNMRNVLRDEAVSIAEMRMNEARNIPFASLTAGTEAATASAVALGPACAAVTPIVADPYPVGITRNIRNIAGFNFGTQRTIAPLDTDDKQITILVRWVYKNECYSHQISTVRRTS